MAEPRGLCPRCNVALSPLKQGGLVSYVCSVCRGVLLRGQDLQAQFGAVAQGVAEAASVYVPGSPARGCPTGCGPMRVREVAGPPPVHFDACPMCRSVWFDRGEVATIASIMKRRAADRPVALKREYRGLNGVEAAKHELAMLENRQATGDDADATRGGSTLWWLFALLTGLPVEGHNPLFRTPVVTWGLMLTCVAVYAAELQWGWAAVDHHMLRPAKLFDGSGTASLFTSMFMHGSAMHLLGNLYFLKVFGDNVEDRLGRFTFVFFYLACGVGASVAFALTVPHSNVPMLGASGAIAGLLGAYLVFFPDARISLVPGLLTLFRWIHLRAFWYLPFWFGWQFLQSRLFPRAGVAWWAHLGGFIVGFGLALIAKRLVSDARVGAIAADVRR